MAIDFNTIYPWSAMETVTIDGQAMVKIPKYYVKYGVIPEGRPNAGKKGRWVSEKKFPGYHIHPAFVKNGYVMDCFYIASFEAYNAGSNKAGSAPNQTPWVNVNQTDAKTYCTNRGAGWHLQNIYEIAAVNTLLLIELGTPNVQTAIAIGNVNSSAAMATGTTDAVWRDLHEWWGNVWEQVDGFITDANNVYQIFSNQGDGTYVSTGVVAPNSGWITEMSEAKGTNFDLSDVFLPSATDSTESNGTYGDFYSGVITTNLVPIYRSGSWADDFKAGAFVCNNENALFVKVDWLGFRLAKEGTVTAEAA